VLIDYLLDLWITLLQGLNNVLPVGFNQMIPSSNVGGQQDWIPSVLSDVMGLMMFYIDFEPVGFFLQLLFSLFAAFIAYKIINLIFNLVADIL
jgi:hypothetical protein